MRSTASSSRKRKLDKTAENNKSVIADSAVEEKQHSGDRTENKCVIAESAVDEEQHSGYSTEKKCVIAESAVEEEQHSGDSMEDDNTCISCKELQDKLVCLQEVLAEQKRRSEELLKENESLQSKVRSLEDTNSSLESRTFCVDRFDRDQDVAFYTGFPNINVFNAMLEYLDPGTDCENIRPKEKAIEDLPDDFYEEGSEQTVQYVNNKRGPKCKIKPRDQFFIVICRLRRGFAELHLAHLYCVGQSTISRIFVTWINFMYLKFAPICIWPSRRTIDETMPAIFKEKYPHTRVIIDCTEVRCEMPSSLLLNSELFSSYKNHVILKALIGIAPSGAITFISQLYKESISDREIVTRSGFLAQDFECGDQVMADKGFQIDDLLPLGVQNNIPPFLGGDSQMSAENVVKTQQIASVRIHVERAINKIKNFHIWDKVIPLSMFGVVNQMWSVCAFLCNTHDPLISE